MAIDPPICAKPAQLKAKPAQASSEPAQSEEVDTHHSAIPTQPDATHAQAVEMNPHIDAKLAQHEETQRYNWELKDLAKITPQTLTDKNPQTRNAFL